PGLGHAIYSRLLLEFGSPEAILAAGFDRLCSLGLQQDLVREMLACRQVDSRAWQRAEADIDWAAQPGCSIITLASEDYPSLLRHTPSPPPLLFVSGQSAALRLPQLAIVGSRNCSVQGRDTAGRFAASLSKSG